MEKLAEPVQAVENPTDEERMGIARSFPHVFRRPRVLGGRHSRFLFLFGLFGLQGKRLLTTLILLTIGHNGST